jgi:hypothetical protein
MQDALYFWKHLRQEKAPRGCERAEIKQRRRDGGTSQCTEHPLFFTKPFFFLVAELLKYDGHGMIGPAITQDVYSCRRRRAAEAGPVAWFIVDAFAFAFDFESSQSEKVFRLYCFLIGVRTDEIAQFCGTMRTTNFDRSFLQQRGLSQCPRPKV